MRNNSRIYSTLSSFDKLKNALKKKIIASSLFYNCDARTIKAMDSSAVELFLSCFYLEINITQLNVDLKILISLRLVC